MLKTTTIALPFGVTDRNTLSEADVLALEPVLMGFAYRAVRQRDVARDLVQETYLAVLEALPSFEGRSSLRTWVVGILSRKVIDHYRRTKREVVSDDVPEPRADDLFTATFPKAPGSQIDPQRAIRVLDEALGELPELERMAVLLCDVEQVDRENAATTMHVEPSHLRVLLHRGRTKLRHALELAETPRAVRPPELAHATS